MSHVSRDFTATTFVVLGGWTLLLYHKQLRQWFPPGGHIHRAELPCDAAVREVREESGLEVELLSSRSSIGQVGVLSQPECILLEEIAPGHQHIDLIYFASVIGGCLKLSEAEAEAYWWCTAEELESPDIAEDIRRLGKMAIERAEGRGQRADAFFHLCPLPFTYKGPIDGPG